MGVICRLSRAAHNAAGPPRGARAVGSEPPPLLTLANAEAFEGITDVRKVLVDKRADPRETYKGNCAYDVAKARQNPMFY